MPLDMSSRMRMLRYVCRHCVNYGRRQLSTNGTKDPYDPGTFFDKRPEFLQEGPFERLYRWWTISNFFRWIQFSREGMTDGCRYCVGKLSDALESGNFDQIESGLDPDVLEYWSSLRTKKKGLMLKFDNAKVRRAWWEWRDGKPQNGQQSVFAKAEVELILRASFKSQKKTTWKHEMWTFESPFAVVESKSKRQLSVPNYSFKDGLEWRLVNISLY